MQLLAKAFAFLIIDLIDQTENRHRTQASKDVLLRSIGNEDREEDNVVTLLAQNHMQNRDGDENIVVFFQIAHEIEIQRQMHWHLSGIAIEVERKINALAFD